MAPPQASSTAPVFYYRNVKIDVIASELILRFFYYIHDDKLSFTSFNLIIIISADTLNPEYNIGYNQGTSRRMNYHVLFDENRLNPEASQILTSLACQLNISSAHVAREGNKVANWLAEADFRIKNYYGKIGTSSSSSPQNVGNKIQYPRDNEAINQCLKIELEGGRVSGDGAGQVPKDVHGLREAGSESKTGRVWTRQEVELWLSLFYVEYYERSLGGVGGGASSLMFIYKVVK
ncbi:hypothetical protein LguiA_022848 [Lonicera macranthoides]